MSYEITQRIVGLSLVGTMGVTGLNGALESCEPRGDKADQSMDVPFDAKAGKHNHDLSMGGTVLQCTGVEFVQDGDEINVTVTVSPKDLKGVHVKYEIQSTEPTVAGMFAGTDGTISANGVGRHSRAYAKIAFPFGDDAGRIHTDDCNGQSVPIQNAK